MSSQLIRVKGLEIVLALHTEEDPLPTEWDRFLVLVKADKADVDKRRTLAVSDGGAPNAKQRRSLAEVYASNGRPNRAAGVTHKLKNPVMRGIATAVAWINPEFLAVTPDEGLRALRHLGVEDQVTTIVQELGRLQQELPTVTSLVQLTQRLTKL